MTLTTVVWSLIFVGAASLWWPRLRRVSLGVLSGAYLWTTHPGLSAQLKW